MEATTFICSGCGETFDFQAVELCVRCDKIYCNGCIESHTCPEKIAEETDIDPGGDL